MKNSDSVFEFANPENPIVRAKNVSIFHTELKYVHFWLSFVKIWLPWQLPLLL